MKIECVQEKLAGAVSIAERVAGKHVTLPVLSCLLLDAQKNQLTIRATNLDLGLEIIVPAKTDEEGIVAVPANILSSFISGASQGDKGVKIFTKDANIVVEASHSRGTIKTMPVDDFPSIPRVSDGTSFTVNGADFVKGLKSVWYSASISGIKPELSSVYIYSDDGTVVFAATDSFRLAEKRIRLKKSADFTQILIPFKNIPEIIRVFDQVNDDISVTLSKNQISFDYKGLYLVSRVIDGVFPDYKQIIPKQSTTEVVVLKQDLIDGLKVSHIFSDKFNQITMVVDPKTKEFSLKTKNADVGENTHNLEATIEGDAITINFNYKYITDCFQSIDSDSITLLFNGLNRPMVMHPATDKSFTYLVMPMNR
ncbi:MAG: polymerase subunit beta, polymerase subunit beta protein [Candidatus Taylorbacteria bacterium]|nr:polymerase subunit beta, polymerase subunit beta protein [Candidatus Taylorbacteria bacterium]